MSTQPASPAATPPPEPATRSNGEGSKAPAPRAARWLPDLALSIHVAFALFLFGWFRIYLSSDPIAAVDLPGHLTAVEGLRRNIWTLTYTFYDVSCFTGYAAFHFYAFLGHMLTALLSIPLAPFAEDPIRVAAHVMLLLWQATLPISMTWAMRPLAMEVLDEDADQERRWRWILAATHVLFAFWFINHDHQWYGIGAAAVMNIGLFSQAFGWHFMILHFGALVRLLREGTDGRVRLVALMFALLFLTHTMTAIFSFYLAFMSFMWFHNRRWMLVKSHFMGFMIMGFWMVPMAAYMSSYTGLDIHRPQGDFLEIMLRYPFFGVLRSIRTWLSGKFLLINFTELFLVVVMTCALALRQVQKARTLIAFLGFTALGAVILTNGFIASSFPMGFHYYRFIAYLLLFILLPLSVVPLAMLRTVQQWGLSKRAMHGVTAAMVVALCVCFGTTVALPHNERERVARTVDRSYLKNEFAVLDWFKNQPTKGRVLFEYFSNYDKFPFLSCHFMTTRLLKDTGFEAINGLFVQSSLAYHFPMGSANQLKANSYNGPLLYPAVTDLTDDTKVRQMLEFGVTHVVLYQDEFYNRIKKFTVGEPVVIGPYRIVTLQQLQAPRVGTVNKRVAVYSDLRGNVPFKFMELYFYAKEKLSPSYELLHAKPGDDLPKDTELIVLHGKPGDVADAAEEMKAAVVKAGGQEPRVVSFTYRQEYLTKHYGTWYQHNPEIDDFSDLGKWLDKENVFKDVPTGPRSADAPAAGTLRWDSDYQGFELSGLLPGKLYRINYSHFPYWRSGDGEIYRGTGDRIFFIPERDTARFTFTRWRSLSTYVGWLMTIFGVWWLWRGRRRTA